LRVKLFRDETMNDNADPLPAAFGSWQFESSTETPGVSFGIDSAEQEAVPVWRRDFPSDPDAADAELSASEALAQESLAELNMVPGRIDELIDRVQAESAGGVSFATTSMETLDEPEAELLDLLDTINRPAVGVSFAVGGEDRSKIEQAFDQFGADMNHLLRLVTHFAWVETEIEGQLLGRSVVSWTGDLDTNWATGLEAEVYQLHKRSLKQALGTRNIALHAVTITAQSAAKLTVLLAAPGGALLALPVAWKFVKQILADIQKYKDLTQVPL
jgi:hypothetical protein